MLRDRRTISPRTVIQPFYAHLGYVVAGTSPMPAEIAMAVPSHFVHMSKSLQKVQGGSMKRTLVCLLLLCCASAAMAQEKKDITANEVIERIKKNLGVPWKSETVDTFKFGNQNAKVNGIVTTMMT